MWFYCCFFFSLPLQAKTYARLLGAEQLTNEHWVKKRLQGICWNRKMIQMLQIWCDLKPPVDMLWPYYSYYSLLKTRFIILSLNCRSRGPLQNPRNDNVIHTLMFLCFSAPLLNFKMMGWLVRCLYGRMNGWLLGSRLRL